MFIVLAGCAFALDGRLGWIGYRYGQREHEIRRKWMADLPATAPGTMPFGEFQEQLLAERDKQLVIADRYRAKSKELYMYCGVLAVLWGIAAVNTWKRRWPGDRN